MGRGAACELLRGLDRFPVEFLDGNAPALLLAAQVVSAVDQCLRVFGTVDVTGDVCRDGMRSGSRVAYVEVRALAGWSVAGGA
ncbi:hypothetical protein [Streptomyces sp. NBC_01241]|uniref:hypothetical protein n=1 Tax=Streptomyces sp. NBC_01241 TaxID=2903794 RepID=UPI003D80A93D